MTKSIDQHEGKKYQKVIRSCTNNDQGLHVDVYEVLEAFGVTCPARQHAIKKLLMAGGRGKGSELADLIGAEAAVCRAIELQKRRETVGGTARWESQSTIIEAPPMTESERAEFTRQAWDSIKGAKIITLPKGETRKVGDIEIVPPPPYTPSVVMECDSTTAPSVGIGQPATLPKSDWLTITDEDVKQAAAESGRTVDGIIATMEACVPVVADPPSLTTVKNADGTITATNLPPVRKVYTKDPPLPIIIHQDFTFSAATVSGMTKAVSRMEAKTNASGEISIGGHLFEPDLKGVNGEVLHLMDKTCRYCRQKWFSFTGTMIPVCPGSKVKQAPEPVFGTPRLKPVIEVIRTVEAMDKMNEAMLSPKPAFTTAPASMVPADHVPVSQAEYVNVLEIKLGGHHFTPDGPVTESTTFERACVFCDMKWMASGYAKVGHFPKCKGPTQDEKSTDLVHSE
jgi:hypothetical protein